MCDDVCLAELTEQVLADTAWSSFRDLRPLATALGADRPVDPIVPAQEGQWDAWSTVEVRDGGPWFLSQPPEGVWGAFRVWNTEGGREVPVDSRVCLASAGGGRLVTSEGPGCSQVHVRSLPALELVESRELGFSIVGLWAAPDGWLAVGEDGAAAWVMSGKTWTGVLNPLRPRSDGPRWGRALRWDEAPRAGWRGAPGAGPGLVSGGLGGARLRGGVLHHRPHRGAGPGAAALPEDSAARPRDAGPDDDADGRAPRRARRARAVVAIRPAGTRGGNRSLCAARSWTPSANSSSGCRRAPPGARAPWGRARPSASRPPPQTLHAEVSGADDSLDVQARCRVRGRWGHIVWRGRCEDRVARLRDRPMVLGAGTMRRWRVIDEYRTRPYVDVPAVASGRWFIRSWDPIDDEVDGSDWLGPVLDGVRVTADAQHAVHLSNGGEPELCLTVTPPVGGGDRPLRAGPVSGGARAPNLRRRVGAPHDGDGDLARRPGEGGHGGRPSFRWRGGACAGPSATATGPPCGGARPPVSLPPVTLDGEWVQLETGDRYLVRDDVVQRGSSGGRARGPCSSTNAGRTARGSPTGSSSPRPTPRRSKSTCTRCGVLSLWHRRPEAHAPTRVRRHPGGLRPGGWWTPAERRWSPPVRRFAGGGLGPRASGAAAGGPPFADARVAGPAPPRPPTVPGGLAWQTVGPRGTPVAVALGGPANASVTSSPRRTGHGGRRPRGLTMPGLWVRTTRAAGRPAAPPRAPTA
jgi:hypothetical protein